MPSDQYIAYMNDRLHETDRDVLMLLYQPLIGAVACGIYMTLASELSRHPGKTAEKTHKSLMIFTGKHLDEIFQERKKLEAIGLLKVYRVKKAEEIVHYYELLPPLSPEAFFKDDLLSVFLYNRLGSKEQYLHLRNLFRIDRVEDEEKEEITRSFDQVFVSLHPSEMNGTHPDMLAAVTSAASLEGRNTDDSRYHLGEDSFDFSAMLAFLPAFVPKEPLQTKENQTAIKQLAFLYKLDPLEMSKVLQDAMVHSDDFDPDELRKHAKQRYRLHEADKPPRLGLRTQPPELRSLKTAPKTEEEKQIHYFETTSPLEYLEEQSNGAKVYPGDIEIIEQLLFEYKLPPGVVNVLLEYMFIQYDKKLSKALAYKIASHWRRANIRTVKEAMDFAKKEYSKLEERKKNQDAAGQKQPAQKSTKSTVRQEPLPKWMTDESWNTAKENEDEWLEAKKKVAQYREMLKNTRQEGE